MIIGIDPDIDKPGVCILHDDGVISFLKSMLICDFLEDVNDGIFKGYCIAIEDVSKIKATFKKKGVANHAANTRVSNNIGMVQGAHRIIKGWCEYNGLKVIDVPAGIGKQVKKNADLFNQLSGWNGTSNEDMRDAWAIEKWAQNKENK